MVNALLFDIGIVIIIATICGFFARLLKQPLILAYILAGAIIGPAGLGLVIDKTVIMTLSELGIAFLLFTVGLEMDIRKLKAVGLVSSISGILQIIMSLILGYILAIAFGFSQLGSIYIALALAFSSTMIVVKLLSDKKELDTLHGRMLIAILLVQDVIAIFALSFLATFKTISFSFFGISLLKVSLLFLVAILSSKFILPRLFKSIAKSEELLFLSAVSWCLLFALISYYTGFSIAIGAFLAGLTLALSPYNLEIIGKVKPLRSFFATIFFVALGMQLIFVNISHYFLPIIIFTLLVLIGNPLMVMIPVSLFGYKKRTSFLTGIGIAQTSEFSLIIVSLGLILGHISQEIVSIVVIITAITITISSYFIIYDDKIYKKSAGFLTFLDIFPAHREKLEYAVKKIKKPIIIFGGHRTGRILVDTFKKLKKEILVVDFNPEIIKILISQKIPCVYGDIVNLEVLEKINLENAKMVISTIPNKEDNLFLIEHVKAVNPKAKIFVTTVHMHEAFEFYEKGADYVILPHVLTGEKIASILNDLVTKKKSIKKLKKEHIKKLEQYSKKFVQLTRE